MRILLCILLGSALAFPAWAKEAPAPVGGLPTGGEFLLAPLAARTLAAQAPGSWIEYVATLEGRPVGSYLRYVYAGRSEEGLWLELWLSSRPGSAATAFRILLEADAGGGLRPKRVWQRLFGGRVAEVALPPEAAGARRPQATEVEEGTSRIMTRAGSFAARTIALREGGEVALRLYLVDALPLFGLARMDLGMKQGLEVHAFGEASAFVFEPVHAEAP